MAQQRSDRHGRGGGVGHSCPTPDGLAAAVRSPAPRGGRGRGQTHGRTTRNRKHHAAARQRLSAPATGYFKKNFGHSLRNPNQRYQRIDAMKTQHPIRSLCTAMEVSPSGYYDWVQRQIEPGPRARENAQLMEQIQG